MRPVDRKDHSACIESVGWQRTYLLASAKDGCNGLALRRFDGLSHEFSKVPEGLSGNFDVQINIANAARRDLLEEGVWTFVDANTGNPARVNKVILGDVENLTRSFFFHKKTQLYSVRFFVPKDDFNEPRLCLEVSYYRKDKNPKRDMSLVKMAKRLMNLYYQIIAHVVPKNGKRVLLMTENNESLSGNLAALDRRLRERGLDKEFVVTRSSRNIFSRKTNPFEWLRVLTMIAQQDYIFVEDYVPVFAAINLSPKTKLIQVWHAGFGFKLVGFGRFGIDESPNPFASCHRKYTYALVGNVELRDVYAEVFGIEREALLATGMPRLDHFLDDDSLNQALLFFDKEFPDVGEKRVILFAPTYRGGNQKEVYYDFDQIDFAALSEYCDRSNSVVLFKMHRFITAKVPIPEDFGEWLIDASDFEINDLLPRADVLITDYSSCFYDYLLLGRPVIFYAYDEAYYSATRGVHRCLSEIAPGPVCGTFAELLKALELVDEKNFVEREMPKSMLLDRCAERTGLASDRVIDYVLLGVKDEDVCLS